MTNNKNKNPQYTKRGEDRGRHPLHPQPMLREESQSPQNQKNLFTVFLNKKLLSRRSLLESESAGVYSDFPRQKSTRAHCATEAAFCITEKRRGTMAMPYTRMALHSSPWQSANGRVSGYTNPMGTIQNGCHIHRTEQIMY